MTGDGTTQGEDFTGLTVGSLDTGHLVFERHHLDGRMQVWVAPPGYNDGPGMWLTEADAQRIVAFLSGGR